MQNKTLSQKLKQNSWKIIAILICSVIFLAEATLHSNIVKIIEEQAHIQIEKLKLDLSFGSIDYGYFPPNLHLNQVSFKNDQVVTTADTVKLSVSFMPLIRGQIKAGSLYIDNLNASINLLNPRANSKNQPLELKLEKITKLIPIEHVLLSNSKLILLQKKDVYSFDLDFLEFEKLFDKLQLEIKSKIGIRTRTFKDNFFLNSKVRWQEKGVFINFFTLQKENSILQISGFLKEQILKTTTANISLLHKNITELRLSINADLRDFNDLFIKFVPKKILSKSKVKDFSGRLQASGYYFPGAQDSASKDKGSLKLKANELVTPLVKLKELNFDGEIDTESLKSNEFNLKLSDQSSLEFHDLLLKKYKSNYSISIGLKSKNLQIEDVIRSLNLKADSLKIPVALDAQCGGSLHKELLIKCTGSGGVSSFNLLQSNKDEKFISTKGINSTFSTFIRKDSLDIDATISHINPASKLKAEAVLKGSVNYISGFDLNFETSTLDLGLINTISGLKFSGETSLKGSTKGTSKWGTFQADLTNKSFKLNEFFLGDSTARIFYEFPNLSVKSISGNILDYENTYTADFVMDVDKKSMTIGFLGQKVSDRGLRRLFSDLFELPLDMKFQTNVILSATGSTDINLMDVDLKTKASELDIFGEKFESGNIEINGKQGNWTLTKGNLAKQNASIEARGSFQGLKTMDLRLISKDMSFEDSDFIKNLGVKISGPLDLTLNAKGPISGPEAVGTLVSRNSSGPNKSSLGSSNLGYRLFEDEVFFKGDIFGDSFIGEGFYPLKPNGKMKLNGVFRGFDVLNFLNFNSENIKNTHLFLSGKTDFIRSKEGAFKGNLDQMNVTLRTDQRTLLKVEQIDSGNLKKPIVFKTLQKDDEAKFIFDLSKKNQKSLSFSGSLDISFLQPLIPTCEFINGRLRSENFSWSQKSSVTNTKGSATIDSANFKSDAFPYAINKIKSEINTSGSKLYLSGLTAFLSNTKINGSGQIQTASPSSIDLDLSYQNLDLEFPPKIFTTSDGNFRLYGNSIPLGISGKLLVKKGVYAADILTTNSAQTVMPNKRLPEEILRTSSPPAELKNVQITIKNKMKVLNSEADGYAKGELTASGNPADPIVKGKINLKKGFQINFQDNAFNVKEGSITYRNKTLDSPEVFIDASTNAIKDNNDPLEKAYFIRMLADGPPTDLKFDFSSQPSLDYKQIISLLTIGTISTQSLGQEINAQEQAAYSGFQFGSYLLQRNKAIKDLKKNTGIEIGMSSSLTSFGVSPKVEAKKGWTPKLSSSLSQTFGNQRNLEFKNEYKLNKKTSTILGVQNNQTNDAAQLNNRRVRQGVILDLGLQYKFEFD